MVKSALTCTNPIQDGVGAQALRQFSIVALAQHKGIEYFHTPFISVAHNEDKDANWTKKWNVFFNLSHISARNTKDCYRNVEASLPKQKKRAPGTSRIFKRLLMEKLKSYSGDLDVGIVESIYEESVEILQERDNGAAEFNLKTDLIELSEQPSVFWTLFGDVYGIRVLNLLGLDPTPPTEAQYEQWRSQRRAKASDGSSKAEESPYSTLYALPDALSFCHGHPEAFLPVIPRLRMAYFANDDKPSLCYEHCLPAAGGTTAQPLVFTVAVHIRRGDIVKKHSKHGEIERLVPCSHFSKVIQWMQNIGKVWSVAWDIHVYSQGSVEEFAEIDSAAVTFHLDEDVFSTFHHLVSAQVLVMSRSDFSYAAGLLSQGTKLCPPPPFWHPAVPGWLEQQTGQFDSADFMKSLKRDGFVSCANGGFGKGQSGV